MLCHWAVAPRELLRSRSSPALLLVQLIRTVWGAVSLDRKFWRSLTGSSESCDAQKGKKKRFHFQGRQPGTGTGQSTNTDSEKLHFLHFLPPLLRKLRGLCYTNHRLSGKELE